MKAQETKSKHLIIITGMSGAGKSLAMKCLEDQDYYCADNIPPSLVPAFVGLCVRAEISRIAVAVDIRVRGFFADIDKLIASLPAEGFSPFIIFLEASTEVLTRRFSETRRQHPLAANARASTAIRKERALLAKLRGQANVVLDTSALTPHRLRAELMQCLPGENKLNHSAVHLVSFGFKHGCPNDVDMLFDCRFLPNPYYVKELRPLSGCDKEVSQYVFSFAAAQTFTDKVLDILEFVLPNLYADGKHHLTVAFGCTGGRHRSAAITEACAKALRGKGYQVSVEHRDLENVCKSVAR